MTSDRAKNVNFPILIAAWFERSLFGTICVRQLRLNARDKMVDCACAFYQVKKRKHSRHLNFRLHIATSWIGKIFATASYQARNHIPPVCLFYSQIINLLLHAEAFFFHMKNQQKNENEL